MKCRRRYKAFSGYQITYYKKSWEITVSGTYSQYSNS